MLGIDYFTKWIEAEPLARIIAQNVQKFTWKNIICMQAILFYFATDNGTQFTNKRIEELCANLGIKHQVSTIKHPQTNSHVEAVNKVILVCNQGNPF